MRKSGGNGKNRGLAIVGVIAAMVLVLSIAAIIAIKYHAYKANRQYEDIQNQMTNSVETDTAAEQPVTEQSELKDAAAQEEAEAVGSSEQAEPSTGLWDTDYVKSPDKEVNFAELQSINPDVYAWMTVPGTEIDYPIAHCDKDDAIYLEQDINHKKSAYGMIFTDTWNPNDFSDRMTLIYGHNMKDGSMFAGLHAFRDSKFFNEHDTIKIYMPEGELDYKIFACYTAKNEHILEKNNFADDVAYLCYIEDVKNIRDMSANIRDMEIGTEDRMITLVTCIGDQSKRLFVQAVLQEPSSDE